MFRQERRDFRRLVAQQPRQIGLQAGLEAARGLLIRDSFAREKSPMGRPPLAPR